MLSGFNVPKSLPLEARNSSLTGKRMLLVVLELQNDIVTAKEYEEALKKWQKEKIETNAKYQKELANHVK